MNKFNDDTCFLFSDPSFLSGFGAVIDIGGTWVVYNESKSGNEADCRAILSDWSVVGNHLVCAAKALEEEEVQQAA